MIQLLHLSDLHLNAGFANKEAHIREQLKAGLIQSFERALHYAIQTEVDGVLLIGDIFDHPQISYKLERLVVGGIEDLLSREIHVFCVTGNHDPAGTMPYFSKLADSPFFHLFDQAHPQTIILTFKNGTQCRFIGVGHSVRNEQRDLIQTFPSHERDMPCVGMAHASVLSVQHVGEKEAYMATALHTITGLKYDYFALGHIHVRQQLARGVAYSGNIQGLNYKETGEKGGWLVKLTSDEVTLEAVNFNEIEWLNATYDVPKAIDTILALENDITTTLQSQLALKGLRTIVRIELKGRTTLYRFLMKQGVIDELAESLTKRWGVLHVDIKDIGLSNDVDFEALKREQTVLAMAMDMAEHLTDYPELLAHIEQSPILESLTGDARRMAIEALTKSIIPELVNRMLKEHYEN